MADYISQITLPDNSTYDLKDAAALPKSGGQMTGPLTWKNSTALPETTSGQYFLVIDAFSNGGTTKWIGKANALTSLGAAASSHNHNGVYVPNTSGANDANTLVNTGIYNITSGSLTNGPKDYGYGQLLVMSYRKHTGNTTTDWASQLYLHNGGGTASGNASAPGNVLYYRTSNSASSNTWFDWQKAVHVDAAYTKIGDTNKPVYIAEDGTATEISYTIEKSVPSNAVFTDHYAWGDITGKPTKITLTGAVTGNVSLGAGELSLSTTVNHNHDTDYVKKISSDDNAIARFDGTAGQIQNSGVLIDDNNNVTTTGHFILEKASNVTWATSGQNTEPAFEMKGATKTFKFKFSAAGENVDVGWDWTAGDGSGAFFRSTKASSNAGMFGFFARKTLSNGTKTSSELWGYASDTNNGGKLIWAGRRVVTATDNTQIGSATQPVYISNTGIATACTALKALAYKDSLTSSDIPDNAANTTGNAAGANRLNNISETIGAGTRPTNANITHVTNGGMVHYILAADDATGNLLHFHWDTSGAWDSQLLVPHSSTGSMKYRASSAAGTWDSWRTLLDSNNSGAGTNNNATLAWSTTYTIAKINGTDIKFTTMAKPSYSYSDISNRPTSIKLTGAVTGTVTLNNGENSIATSVNHNHDDHYKIASGVITLGSSTITPVTSVNGHTGSSVSVTAGDLGLSSALRYQGTTTTAMEDGRTTAAVTIGGNSFTPTAGDVVIYNDAEYLWTGSLWELIGAESSFKKVQTAVNTSTASGSSATTFVSSVTQDTQGVITVKTSTLDTSGEWSGNAGTATNISSKTPILAVSQESNEIKVIDLGNNNPVSGAAQRHAIDFRWYNSHWAIGNLRTSSSSSAGFGFSYSSDGGTTYSNLVTISTSGKITATGGFSGNLTGNVTGNADSASQIQAALDDTHKTYLLGTQTDISATAGNVTLTGDTKVYLNTTAGSLSAKYYQVNDGTNEKVTLQWNSTDSSLDFVFA